ncbi:hypothetical protein MVEN_01781300 [Mycena venus]|uniref:Uncharacterized protein n=1 Tax=Mycena venus TaxID=2733690 RepID=A0A8H6XMT5_9AGAR|nr:hypothetical protein MVEN_01781300 [Mycena venus]
MDLASTDELRQRIAALEVDLQKAQAAKEEAESSLENHRSEQKHAEHARHAARNLASYGHNDKIIFVHPEDLDQGLIYRLSKGQGPSASVCRVMVRYNLDQFLKRPRLHQWLSAGKIYREAGEQQSSRFELFFDLLFVGMVHQISEAAAEEPTGIGFAKYVLTFVPAFGIWADIRDIANQFSNDDVTQRAYILWISVLLVGYSNNASAIKFGATETGVEGAPEGGILTEDSFTAMRWTLGLFCLAKLSKVALQLVYALFLPLSRKPLIVSTLNSIPTAILFFIAIFTSLHVTIALVVVGLLLDYLLRVIGVLLYKTMEVLGRKYERKRQLHNRQNSCPWSLDDEQSTPGLEKSLTDDQGFTTVNSSMTAVNEEAPLGAIKICQRTAAREEYRVPAINIEHHVERLGAFITVILGEMVVGVFFKASSPVGLNTESGRAILGLMIAFNLNWMYFGSQACKHFIHAIRRHWLAGFLFTFLHLPLCMSLLLASSAINRLVTSASVDSEAGGGLKWFFGAGLGASVWTMATIGVLHKNLDDEEGLKERKTGPTRRTISRRFVLGIRYIAGLAMILVPIVEDLTSIQFLAIYVGITAFLIIEEIIARIEKREQELDASEEAGEVVESAA